MTNLSITNPLPQQTPNNRSIFASDASLGKDANISAKGGNEASFVPKSSVNMYRLTGIPTQYGNEQTRKFMLSAAQQKKQQKLQLLDTARRLLRKYFVDSNRTGKPHRTRFCLATRIDNAQFVGITLNENPDQSTAGLDNLQTCGSICSCPVCAERKMLEYAQTVKKLLQWGKDNKHAPILVSLTASHHAGTKLEEFESSFRAAWQMFTKNRKWRDFLDKFGISNWIASRECTREAITDNGWHYHMHQMLMVDKRTLAAAEVPAGMYDEFSKYWIHCLEANGLTGSAERACDVRGGEHVGAEYLTKLGITENMKGDLEFELTGAANKGNTIWDVLNDAMLGDIRSEYLYVEYVRVMQGKKWFTKSHGLDALLENVELPAADTDIEKQVPWMWLAPDQWRTIVSKYAISDVLMVAARYRNPEKVLEYIEALRE
jgi:hypothetical protein